MCHKPLLFQTIKQQQGSALVVALFIIIVMGLLVGSMSRLLVSSSESISYEVLGTRAFFAAQSGMERSLSLLYALDATNIDSCPDTASCDETSLIPKEVIINFEAGGLEQCEVRTRCSCSDSAKQLPDNSVFHFYLASTATCGTGAFTSSRTIEMEVWQ
jgi:MSHA biogenesis protein MshP